MKTYHITPINKKSFAATTDFEKAMDTTSTYELYRHGTAEAMLTDAEIDQIKSLSDGEEFTLKSAFIYDCYDVCYSESDVEFFELHEDWEFDDQTITVIGPCEIEEIS